MATELEQGGMAGGRVGGMDARSTAELVATCTAAATAAMLKATSLPVSEQKGERGCVCILSCHGIQQVKMHFVALAKWPIKLFQEFLVMTLHNLWPTVPSIISPSLSLELTRSLHCERVVLAVTVPIASVRG